MARIIPENLRPKLVTVDWIDSCGYHGWRSLDAENSEKITEYCRCVSTGTLLYRDDNVLVVAGSFGLDKDGHIDQVCDVTTIPAVCVTRVKRGLRG